MLHEECAREAGTNPRWTPHCDFLSGVILTTMSRDPFPDALFQRLESGGEKSCPVASAADVIDAAFFWHDFGRQWESIEDRARKANKGPEDNDTVAAKKLLLARHRVAERAILWAAERERIETDAIREAGPLCRAVVQRIREVPKDALPRAAFCNSYLGASDRSPQFVEALKVVKRAEKVLVKLHSRMKMRDWAGQMPGGDPMPGRTGDAPEAAADGASALPPAPGKGPRSVEGSPMREEDCADDRSLALLAETLLAWMYEPIPSEYFDPFSAELGGSPSIATPLDVLRLAVFWRSLPWRWEKITEKRKGAEGKEYDLLSADIALLHANHDVAREVIVAAAEAERMNSTPIIESDRFLMEVMGSPERGRCVDNWARLWPECLSSEARFSFAKEWRTACRAETLLKRLDARMWVMEKQGRMPGGAPLKRKEGRPRRRAAASAPTPAADAPAPPASAFSFGPGQALYDGRPLKLPTGLAVEVLKKLVDAMGRVVPFKELDAGSLPKEASDGLRTGVRNVRRALKKGHVPHKIENVKRHGYMLS